MLCVFFYELSMEKIAQGYMFKKLFCRSSARKNYVFAAENNLELWGFFFCKTECWVFGFFWVVCFLVGFFVFVF